MNFCIADVKDGIGPFLAIFLMETAHWDAAEIGVALTAGGLATVLARTPAGALVDATPAKRRLLVAAAFVVVAASVTMALRPAFWPVFVSQAANGVADAIFPSAIAAISLGIVGRAAYSARVGRNEAFNHGGNAVVAVLTGLAGYLIAPAAALWIVALLAALSVASILAVRSADIDHRLARGADDGDHGKSEADGIRVLIRNRPLLWFTAAITLFHFANAAMLPLAGEKLARGHAQTGTLFMASCIIVAQAVMIPMAILVGRRADRWGRKWLFLSGFAVLPLRGLLFAVVNDPYAVVAVQALDGVGAGIFGALFLIVVADLTEGTGRYNLAMGLSSACWGLGAALSNTVAGAIVTRYGFDPGFLLLSAFAVAALAVFLVAVPETKDWARRSASANQPAFPGTARART